MAKGLSPRVRGNLTIKGISPIIHRSIPARAGEPPSLSEGLEADQVYPRACGGTASPAGPRRFPCGLSPRVRGNRNRLQVDHAVVRSIPARAGEPYRRHCCIAGRPVYPRACGGTRIVNREARRLNGLSPRVRGNHRHGGSQPRNHGSIPARAGEPNLGPDLTRMVRVYPRACGGTVPSTSAPPWMVGLSPRVRGEPVAGLTPSPSPEVYPRACGGTNPYYGFCRIRTGLSPRVRGNLAQYLQRFSRQGLSPRVRGNQHDHAGVIHWHRSIPARAGEPLRVLPEIG